MKTNNLAIKVTAVVSMLTILALGCLFAYSSAKKFIAQGEFQSSLTNSPLVPENLVQFIGWGVPSVMLLSVIGMAWAFYKPVHMTWALRNYLFWLTLFTGYIILILTVAPYEPCTCIGLNDRWSWRQHLWINMGIIGATLLAYKGFAAAVEGRSHPLEKNGKSKKERRYER